MALYRSRVVEINAVRFDPELDYAGVRVKQALGGGWYVWNARTQTFLLIERGAFLNLTDLNDVYPIAADVFARKYDEVSYESIARPGTEPAQQAPVVKPRGRARAARK